MRGTSSRITSWRDGSTGRWLVLVLLVLAAVIGAWREAAPPAPGRADAPETEFSSARAVAHLEEIAGPRALGSDRHNAVRTYLVEQLTDLGLHVETQRGTGFQSAAGTPYRVGSVANLVAHTKPAGQRQQTLVIAAHYDTVPVSPGANDNGSQVGTLLETARAFQAAGISTDRNVVFVLTDGEEPGFLGADLLVRSPEVLGDVRFFVNLESRGSSGPAAVIRQTGATTDATRALATGSQPLVVSSASEAVMSLLPSGSDFEVYQKAGWSGLELAYFARPLHYDVALDQRDTVDHGSIQQSGAHTLSLARAWAAGQEPGSVPAAGTNYFDLFTMTVVELPLLVVGLIALLAAAGWVALARRTGAPPKRLLGSAARSLAGLVGAAALGAVILPVTRVITGGRPYEVSQGDFPGMPGFLVIVLAGAILLAILVQRSGRETDPRTAAMGLALVLLGVTAVLLALLPDAAYVPLLPVITLIVVTALGEVGEDRSASARAASLSAIVVGMLGVALLSAFVILALMALTTLLLAASATLSALVGLLVDALYAVRPGNDRTWRPRARWLAIAPVGALAVAVLAALVVPVYAQPIRFNTALYCYNGDDQQGFWATLDDRTDSFTAQIVGPDPRPSTLASCLPPGPLQLPHGEVSGLVGGPVAPPGQYAVPELEVLSGSSTSAGATVSFRVTGTPGARLLNLWLVPADGSSAVPAVATSTVDGEPIPPGPDTRGWDRWAVTYHNPDRDGVVFELTTTDDTPITVRVASVIEESLPGAERDEGVYAANTVLATSTPFRDAVIITGTYPVTE